MLQIIGDLHPASRIVLLMHLDRPSLSTVVRAIRIVFSRVAEEDKCYPPKVARMLRYMVAANPKTLKNS